MLASVTISAVTVAGSVSAVGHLLADSSSGDTSTSTIVQYATAISLVLAALLSGLSGRGKFKLPWRRDPEEVEDEEERLRQRQTDRDRIRDLEADLTTLSRYVFALTQKMSAAGVQVPDPPALRSTDMTRSSDR